MTVKERIKELNDDSMISIGTTTSFIFIGTKAELLEDVSKIEKYNVDRFNHLITRSFNKIEARKNRVYVDDADIKNNKEQISRHKKNIKSLKRIINDYQPILDRDICKEYARTIDCKGTVFIIDGPEQGLHWYRQEYVEWRKKLGEF